MSMEDNYGFGAIITFILRWQGKLLDRIAADSKQNYTKQKVVEGHTLPQVIAGTIMGVIIGTIVSQLI